MNVFSCRSIREILIRTLYSRTMENPRYSLRAFARDLSISSSRLSEIMNGKKYGVSRETARKIGTSLKLTSHEIEYLYKLAMQSNKTQRQLSKLTARAISKESANKSFRHIRKDFNGILDQWYFPALIEMLSSDPPIPYRVIMNNLKLTQKEIVDAKNFLVKQAVLTETPSGKIEKNDRLIKIETSTPSAKIKDFHLQMNKLGAVATKEQPIENRKILTSILCFERKDLAAARTEIENFMAKFNKKYSSNRNDSVFCTTIQFFELSFTGDL